MTEIAILFALIFLFCIVAKGFADVVVVLERIHDTMQDDAQDYNDND